MFKKNTRGHEWDKKGEVAYRSTFCLMGRPYQKRVDDIRNINLGGREDKKIN